MSSPSYLSDLHRLGRGPIERLLSDQQYNGDRSEFGNNRVEDTFENSHERDEEGRHANLIERGRKDMSRESLLNLPSGRAQFGQQLTKWKNGDVPNAGVRSLDERFGEPPPEPTDQTFVWSRNQDRFLRKSKQFSHNHGCFGDVLEDLGQQDHVEGLILER